MNRGETFEFDGADSIGEYLPPNASEDQYPNGEWEVRPSGWE